MFEKLVRDHGRVAVDLPYSYDGNCLFHSLAYALHGCVTVEELRAAACDEMASRGYRREYAPFLPPSWGRYVRRMRDGGVWGDGFVMLALARVLCSDITVVSGSYAETFHTPYASAHPHYVLAYERAHYMPTRRVSLR